MRRKSASLFAVSFVAGVVSYSIRDIVYSSVSGPVFFLAGFAALFVPLYFYSALAANQTRLAKHLLVTRWQAEESAREGASDGRGRETGRDFV